ncbi:RtcB family protein [Candidatus Woesearchaeota archaeon]|nr:RtcB family protein [Candidatus Woesearchaeota archaeon]
MPKSFISFDEYLEKAIVGLGKSGLVWEGIKKIEEINYEDEVYDFTVEHKDHNFIANSFLISNCIGGVAAFDVENGGVISPGGIGFDINCGMRLVTTNLTYKDVKPKLKQLVDNLFERVPAGVGSSGFVKLNKQQFKEVIEDGSEWCVKNGYGWDEDLSVTEEEGKMKGADSSKVSSKAIERGLNQIGTLGSGNHYLEIQRVKQENIFDKEIAKKFGLFDDQIVIMFHCLPGDSRILTEHGCWIKIKDLENKKTKIKCFDTITHELLDTEIEEFYKIHKKEKMYKIKTKNGKEITATEDHPFLTKDGLKIIKELKIGEKVSILPYEGVEYEEPSDKVIIKEEDIRKIHNSDKIVNELKEKNLLPLRMNSWQLPILTKLVGYVTGDGHIRKSGLGWRFSVMGDEEDLKKTALDINKLGFYVSKIKKRETKGIITNVLNKKTEINGISNVIECYNSLLSLLLIALETPRGRKTTVDFQVPKWIFRTPLWIQRLYLAGYFGAELTKPILTKSQKKYEYIERPTAAVYKIERLETSGYTFLQQISQLLKKFSIISKVVEERNGGRITNQGRTIKLILRISSDLENIRKLFLKIGYEYCKRKTIESSHVLHFIESKLNTIKEKANELNINVRALKFKPYQYNFSSPIFSRFNFFKYNPPTPVLFDEITDIKEIENKEQFVYDIRIKNKNHNFIADNFIVGNCGSRGGGHQIATDYLSIFLKVMEPKYGIKILDRELACAPFNSKEGQDYFAAMKCGINMSYANRQVILHRIREVFSKVFNKSAEDLEMHQIYDVAHNTAKLEEYKIDGKIKKLLVHRKGSTRAFPPGHEEIPKKYQEIGQPVILGGSMESGSYLLVGTKKGEETFYSTAHGSGRTMSRMQAKRTWRGDKLQKDMENKGIYVKTKSFSGLAEEAGGAYKDVDEVCRTAEEAGISKRVLKLIPIGNVKG